MKIIKKILLTLVHRIPLPYYPFKLFMHKHKCIFVHIPKNAGTSVLRAFKDKGYRKHAKWYDFYESNGYFFEKYTKFAIVREPLSRLYSAYNYAIKGGNRTSSDLLLKDEIQKNSTDFESFILNVLDHDFLMIQILFMPQYVFVFDRHYNKQVDLLLKYENLESDWLRLNDLLGLNLSLPCENQTTKPDVEILLSAQATEKVKALYHLDYTLFNYNLTTS